MNYKKIYDSIIEKRQVNVLLHSKDLYTENHHIIPKSLGGSDDNSNLIRLTAREHFICHYLLSKMYDKESNEWYKMNNAFMIMKSNSIEHDRYFNSRLYDGLRCNFSIVMSESQRGHKNSQFGTKWITNGYENKKIKKYENIPNDWKKGKIVDFDKYRNKTKKELENKVYKEIVKKNKIEKYSSLYKIYSEKGYKEFVEITGYNKSKPNLVQQFKKYVYEYKPQNGKKRGK